MAKMGMADAFAVFGARQKNVQWSVCADGADGCLVVSLWEHHFGQPKDGAIEASGSFDRWKGPGNAEFRAKVRDAYESDQSIRVVIVSTKQTEAVESGIDGSDIEKTFHVKRDWIGKVVHADEVTYRFRFTRE